LPAAPVTVTTTDFFVEAVGEVRSGWTMVKSRGVAGLSWPNTDSTRRVADEADMVVKGRMEKGTRAGERIRIDRV